MPKKSPKSPSRGHTNGATAGFPVVHRRAVGIDVGSKFHVVAVNPELDVEPVRVFQSFTDDLRRLADWLAGLGVTTIAMESTGIYWIPVFEILEERGFEVLLVNASHVKMVPGRKTDFNDAQWIQRLHEHGLLRGSFRPSEDVAVLRSFVRQRDLIVKLAASSIQRMQKALMQMNVQLHHVISDVTGKTGMRIIRAIVSGEHDPATLAALRSERCKSSEETIRAALTGNYRAEHLFALSQSLELYDVYLAKILECDRKIEDALKALRVSARADEGTRSEDSSDEIAAPKQRNKRRPKRRKRSKNKGDPSFDVASVLLSTLGVDLMEIHGFGPNGVLQLIAECGTDMSRWPTAKHFTSWLTLAPGSKISGGKVLSSKTRPSSNRAAHILRMAAVSVGRTNSALGAFYRRGYRRATSGMQWRRPVRSSSSPFAHFMPREPLKGKAVVATARKLAVLFYNTLRKGTVYVDPGANAYEERYRRRSLENVRRRAKSLGYELVEVAAE